MIQQSGKKLRQRGTREMSDNKAMMREICLRIVDENELKRNPKFIDRITFFYDDTISTCLEHKPEIVMVYIDEICKFEKKWYDSNVRNLSLLGDYSIVNCISLFLVISYQLAIDKFDGCEYQFVNVFLASLFNGFSEAVSEQSNWRETVIEELSDTELNFLYACGRSNTMSLALYNHMMKFDRGEE